MKDLLWEGVIKKSPYQRRKKNNTNENKIIFMAGLNPKICVSSPPFSSLNSNNYSNPSVLLEEIAVPWFKERFTVLRPHLFT